jgi:3D (Asp-Asp-Asp) domain-containing protein
MLMCSLLFASWLCFPPQPIVCEPILYDKKAIFTAYNLEASQTDSTPCIGAGSHDLCKIRNESPGKCIVATRLYPLHQLLNIEGIGECEVLDRTSQKYGSRIDILFSSYEEAIKFGKKTLEYRVVSNN